MTTDEQFLKQAIELARRARAAGNHPFGALLVLDGRVVLTALTPSSPVVICSLVRRTPCT